MLASSGRIENTSGFVLLRNQCTDVQHETACAIGAASAEKIDDRADTVRVYRERYKDSFRAHAAEQLNDRYLQDDGYGSELIQGDASVSALKATIVQDGHSQPLGHLGLRKPGLASGGADVAADGCVRDLHDIISALMYFVMTFSRCQVYNQSII